MFVRKFTYYYFLNHRELNEYRPYAFPISVLCGLLSTITTTYLLIIYFPIKSALKNSDPTTTSIETAAAAANFQPLASTTLVQLSDSIKANMNNQDTNLSTVAIAAGFVATNGLVAIVLTKWRKVDDCY